MLVCVEAAWIACGTENLHLWVKDLVKESVESSLLLSVFCHVSGHVTSLAAAQNNVVLGCCSKQSVLSKAFVLAHSAC